MYIIQKTGKKWLFCGTLTTAGLACLGAAVMEGKEDLLWVKITFVMMGKYDIEQTYATTSGVAPDVNHN